MLILRVLFHTPKRRTRHIHFLAAARPVSGRCNFDRFCRPLPRFRTLRSKIFIVLKFGFLTNDELRFFPIFISQTTVIIHIDLKNSLIANISLFHQTIAVMMLYQTFYISIM